MTVLYVRCVGGSVTVELLAPFPEQVTRKGKKEETEIVVARNICATNRKTDKYVSDVENQDIMPKTRNARRKGKKSTNCNMMNHFAAVYGG